MRRFILALLAVSPFAALASSDPPADLPRPAPIPEPVPVGPDFVPTQYYGKVVEITKTTVTIKLQGSLRIEVISSNPNTPKQVYVQDNDQPPKEFIFSDRLLPRPNGVNLVQHG